jgi:hypothetical protein
LKSFLRQGRATLHFFSGKIALFISQGLHQYLSLQKKNSEFGAGQENEVFPHYSIP